MIAEEIYQNLVLKVDGVAELTALMGITSQAGYIFTVCTCIKETPAVGVTGIVPSASEKNCNPQKQ